MGRAVAIKISVFCVIIIIGLLVSTGVKTLNRPDVLRDTGHETRPKENWKASFLQQVEVIIENKSGMLNT